MRRGGLADGISKRACRKVDEQTHLLQIRAPDFHLAYFGALFVDSSVEGALLFHVPSSELQAGISVGERRHVRETDLFHFRCQRLNFISEKKIPRSEMYVIPLGLIDAGI